MIGWATSALTTRILTPQTLGSVPSDRRCVLDVDAIPLDLGVAELSIVAATSQPIRREIGGSAMIRHLVTVDLVVEDGDLATAATRRDAIVTDLVLRLEADRSLGGAASSDGRQYVSRTEWTVDYGAGLVEADAETSLVAAARLVFTVDAALER